MAGTTLPIRKARALLDEFGAIQDRIMQRAYEIFDRSGQIFGRDLDHWLQAEKEFFWKPAIELEEKDNEFRLQIGVPGVDPKDLDIEVSSEDIVVRAELSHKHKEDKGAIHICEFASGNLFRAVHLPKAIDPDKVRAEFKNGMLKIKAEIAKEARTKKVQVDAA